MRIRSKEELQFWFLQEVRIDRKVEILLIDKHRNMIIVFESWTKN